MNFGRSLRKQNYQRLRLKGRMMTDEKTETLGLEDNARRKGWERIKKKKACEMKVGLDNIQKISIYGAQELCIQRKWAMNIGEG